MQEPQWLLKSFSELDNDQLYELLKLRVDVFVVEQQCPYPELDDKDRHEQTKHLLCYQQHQLVAYSRLLAPGVSYPAASIGRIVIANDFRSSGYGRRLVEQSIALITQLWPDQGITIGAQSQLQNFYNSCGFTGISDTYLEDGIEHLDMHLSQHQLPK